MAFLLDSVVPWGRNMEEYREMFLLSGGDMKKTIAGFGDGPASFNAESTRQGCSVVSFDPIYRFSREELERRIGEVRSVVMRQMAENRGNYIWNRIRSLDELETVRMTAMRSFLADYEAGRREGRYIAHALPDRLPYGDGAFDLGLSSHFLLMYTSLGLSFHLAAIGEMLRVCREVRIFPLCDLDAKPSPMIDAVIAHFSKIRDVDVLETDYEFQKGANRLLRIR